MSTQIEEDGSSASEEKNGSKDATSDGNVTYTLAKVDPLNILQSPLELPKLTRKELWSYYLYYVGDNGVSLFNFAPSAFQNFLYIAAGDQGTLLFLGRERTINSIVLLANGISFAIQVILFLILGSFADYGTWRPYILIFWTVAAFGICLAWLAVHEASQWQLGTGLYMVGLIAYQMCLTFWTAAFPALARSTKEVVEKQKAFDNGEIESEELEYEDMIQRNRISNVAFIVQSASEILILAVIVGIMFGLKVTESTANNNRGLVVLIAFSGGLWMLFAIPWFIFEKRRPGRAIPDDSNIVMTGIRQLGTTLRQVYKLKQSLLYLIGFFLLSDSLNTTVTVIGTLQSSIVSYDTLKLTYLLIVGIATQLAGIWLFWIIQKRFRLNTKVLFNAIVFGIIALDGWGMIGIWTQKFGFHNEWEFWLYQAFYGFFVCPWYSFSQTMISEVTPRGREFLFFSLFNMIGKSSAFIGPVISSAIIDASASKNESLPFYFLFSLTLFSFVFLVLFLDLKKSKSEQEKFLRAEASTLENYPADA